MTQKTPIGEDDLQAFLDGRLSPARMPALRAYLAEHPEVAGRLDIERQQRALLRERLSFKAGEPIPARLRVASLRERRRPSITVFTRVAAIAAWIVTGGVAGWGIAKISGMQQETMSASAAAEVKDAMAAHRVFAVETVHPVEVKAEEGAHLTQWLSKRVGRQLISPELKNLGFRLMGGRVIPSEEGVAAQFMYDDDKEARLTIYVTASDAQDTESLYKQAGSLSSLIWIKNGLAVVVTAPLKRDRLSQICDTIRSQFDGGKASPKDLL